MVHLNSRNYFVVLSTVLLLETILSRPLAPLIFSNRDVSITSSQTIQEENLQTRSHIPIELINNKREEETKESSNKDPKEFGRLSTNHGMAAHAFTENELSSLRNPVRKRDRYEKPNRFLKRDEGDEEELSDDTSLIADPMYPLRVRNKTWKRSPMPVGTYWQPNPAHGQGGQNAHWNGQVQEESPATNPATVASAGENTTQRPNEQNIKKRSKKSIRSVRIKRADHEDEESNHHWTTDDEKGLGTYWKGNSKSSNGSPSDQVDGEVQERSFITLAQIDTNVPTKRRRDVTMESNADDNNKESDHSESDEEEHKNQYIYRFFRRSPSDQSRNINQHHNVNQDHNLNQHHNAIQSHNSPTAGSAYAGGGNGGGDSGGGGGGGGEEGGTAANQQNTAAQANTANLGSGGDGGGGEGGQTKTEAAVQPAPEEQAPGGGEGGSAAKKRRGMPEKEEQIRKKRNVIEKRQEKSSHRVRLARRNPSDQPYNANQDHNANQHHNAQQPHNAPQGGSTIGIQQAEAGQQNTASTDPNNGGGGGETKNETPTEANPQPQQEQEQASAEKCSIHFIKRDNVSVQKTVKKNKRQANSHWTSLLPRRESEESVNPVLGTYFHGSNANQKRSEFIQKRIDLIKRQDLEDENPYLSTQDMDDDSSSDIDKKVPIEKPDHVEGLENQHDECMENEKQGVIPSGTCEAQRMSSALAGSVRKREEGNESSQSGNVTLSSSSSSSNTSSEIAPPTAVRPPSQTDLALEALQKLSDLQAKRNDVQEQEKLIENQIHDLFKQYPVLSATLAL